MMACKHGSRKGDRLSFPNWRRRRSTAKRRAGVTVCCVRISTCCRTGRSSTHRSRQTGSGIPLFCEALQKIDYVEYLLDELISGTLEERTAVVKEKEKDLSSLEKRIAAFSARGMPNEQGDGIPGKIRNTRFPEELAM